jgi:hypothetical protein
MGRPDLHKGRGAKKKRNHHRPQKHQPFDFGEERIDRPRRGSRMVHGMRVTPCKVSFQPLEIFNFSALSAFSAVNIPYSSFVSE